MAKKISILVPDLSMGGGQRVAVNTAALLAKHHTVHIVMLSNENRIFDSPVKLLDLKCKKKSSFIGKFMNIFRRYWRYKRLLKQEKYDLSISFLESANLVAFLCDRDHSILTMHLSPEMLTGFDRFIMRHLLRHSKYIVAVSNGLKRELQTKSRFNEVQVINNPINIDSVREQASKGKFIHSRKFIVSAGRITDQKRQDVMMHAFSQSKLSKEHDLIIIGDGEKREQLQTKARKYNANIYFIGERSNPFPIMSAADFFILTSDHEAFPMVLLEALSLSIPVVAYNCPTGLEDIVIHNKNGILIKYGDLESLVSTLDSLTDNQHLLESFSNNCLRSVERYSPENIRLKWEQVFNMMPP